MFVMRPYQMRVAGCLRVVFVLVRNPKPRNIRLLVNCFWDFRVTSRISFRLVGLSSLLIEHQGRTKSRGLPSGGLTQQPRLCRDLPLHRWIHLQPRHSSTAPHRASNWELLLSAKCCHDVTFHSPNLSRARFGFSRYELLRSLQAQELTNRI